MEQSSRQQLQELLSTSTTFEQLENITSQLLTEQEREMLGYETPTKLAKHFLSLSAFAPEPATFAIKEYRTFVRLVQEDHPYSDDQVNWLLAISKDVGVLKETDNPKRVMMNSTIYPFFLNIRELMKQDGQSLRS